MTRTRSAAALFGTLALSASLVLSACGSDSKKDDAKKDTTTTAAADGGSTTSAAKATGVNDKFCGDWKALEDAAAKGPEGGPEAPDAAAMKAFAGQLQTAIGPATTSAPAELTSDVNGIKKVVDDVVNGGDASKLDPSKPDLGKPLAAVEGWAFDNCGWNKVEVKGVDYAFQNLPGTLKSGLTMVKFTNDAKDETHELGFSLVNDGTEASQQKLLSDVQTDPNGKQAEDQSLITFLNATQASPGQTSYFLVDLKPGRYVATCFMPLNGAPDGLPHTTKGMVAPFEVK